jgi:hypothetical protein
MNKVGLEGPEWRFCRPFSDRFPGNRRLSPCITGVHRTGGGTTLAKPVLSRSVSSGDRHSESAPPSLPRPLPPGGGGRKTVSPAIFGQKPDRTKGQGRPWKASPKH